MNTAPISPEDPRLTTYALGEMEDAERIEFEKLLARDPDAMASVAAIRATVNDLESALAIEPLPDVQASDVSCNKPEAKVLSFPRFYYIAGGLAAALSTAAGLLLVVSTSISHDLMKKTLMPQITDKQELRYARIAAAVAIGVAGYLGINPPGFVAQVVAFAFGLAAASLFPAILMGIFMRGMNREGAIAGMLTGLIFTFGYIVFFKFVSPELNSSANWLFGISPEGIGTIGMVLNFLVAFAVRLVTSAPPKEVQQMVEDIRVPTGAGVAHSH